MATLPQVREQFDAVEDVTVQINVDYGKGSYELCTYEGTRLSGASNYALQRTPLASLRSLGAAERGR